MSHDKMAELTKTKTKAHSKKKHALQAETIVSDADVLKALDQLPTAPEDSLESLKQSLECANDCLNSTPDEFHEPAEKPSDELQPKQETLPESDTESLDSRNNEIVSNDAISVNEASSLLQPIEKELSPNVEESRDDVLSEKSDKSVSGDRTCSLKQSAHDIQSTENTEDREHSLELTCDENTQLLPQNNASERINVPQVDEDTERGAEANAPPAPAPQPMYPALDNLSSLSDFNVPSVVSATASSQGGTIAKSAKVAKEVQSVVVPLTNAQIATLYHNPQLQANTEFVEAFLQTVDQSKHEFYEIVRHYYKARSQLTHAEHDVQTLQKEAEHNRGLVWEMQKKTLVLQGQCADRAKVSADHTYTRAVYHEAPCAQMAASLSGVRDVLHEQLALSSYEAQFSRLHVEAYLYKLYKSNPPLTHIPANSPVTVRLERDVNLYKALVPLKTCLNVLFMFVRKPCKCAVFLQDVRLWITRLTSTLLRLADREDHLYLLNQIMRCPAGVGKWAAACVQIVEPPGMDTGQIKLGHPLLDHYLSMLHMALIPIRRREDLLGQMKDTLAPSADTLHEHPWVLVDSDGEEDEDPVNSWHMLQENDLVAVLNQLPVSVAFRHVLGVHTSNDNEHVYAPSAAAGSESATLTLFAFGACVLRVLEQGLHTYSMSRYRQLNKRLARYIGHTVRYIADHLENTGVAQRSDRIQVEFDSLFLKAVTILLSANKFGAWQFLSDLPYRQVSEGSMWRLLWKMHVPDEKRDLFSLSTRMIECQLAEADSMAAFEERLVNMATSEALYLLNTFANMARCRSQHDLPFITLIAMEIYEIAYMSEHTREFCSRQGRELLASVLSQHPDIMTSLLNRTAETMSSIGRVAVFLYKGLPVSLWSPTAKDLTVLQTWLVDNPLDSPESELARTIVEQLNWDFHTQSEDGGCERLWLDVCLHRYMATVLMGAYSKHLSGRHFANTYTIRQMGPWVRSTDSDEDKMATWLWERALRLHLHATTQVPAHGMQASMWASAHGTMQPSAPGTMHTSTHGVMQSSGASAPFASQVAANDTVNSFAQSSLPNVYKDDKFKVIHAGLEKNFGLANYFMLVMTKYGHNLGDFCQEGFEHLEKLVEQGYHLPAIHALSLVIPLLFYNTEYLFTNKRFLKILEQILYLDTSKGGMFWSEFPGPITSYFSAMIQDHIFRGVDGQRGGKTVQFWLTLLTRLMRWHTDRNVLYVLDNLLKAATQLEEGVLTSSLDFFYSLLKTQKFDQEGGFFSSLSSWLGSPTQGSPSMMDGRSWPGLSWLAYAVLLAEERVEAESGVWTQLQQALRHYDVTESPGTVTVDTALKIANKQQSKKVTQAKLTIYRWAQQAIDTPVEDPILPLIWQRFFLLYLGRPVLSGGLPERSSAGDRFFQSGGYLSMIKAMKQKLRDTSAHYDGMVKAISQEMTSVIRETDDAATSIEVDVRCATLKAKMSFYNQAIRLFDGLCFWLDEPLLHGAALYLPALPAEYEAERLKTVIQGETTPWHHLVHWQAVSDDLVKLATQWKDLLSPAAQPSPVSREPMEYRQTAAQRVLDRLKRHDDVLPPPKLPEVKSPVPEVSDNVILDKQGLLFSLRSDFNALVECARKYHTKVSQHLALDLQFVEWLPKLYTNKPTSVTLSVPCRALINPLHSCKGPAALSTIYEGMKEDTIVSRKVDENRAEYKQLLIEALLPPCQHVCSAAVHIEQTITKLITLTHTTKTPDLRASLQNIGVTLFYHVTTFISDDTKFYPPTKQFFTSCTEILGQEFIRSNPNQAQPLMQAILQNDSLLGVLSPNFNPTANPELFLNMYGDMLDVPARHAAEVAFTLLSKFDVHAWLHNYTPPLTQRATLADIIMRALCKCGQQPDAAYNMVFEVYRTHLESALCFSFPDLYGRILTLLLKGSAREELSPVLWDDLVTCLGCTPSCQEDTSRTLDTSTQLSTEQPFIQQLSSKQLEESVQTLGSHLAAERTGTESGTKFGLYPKWKVYVRALGTYTSALIAACTDTVVRDLQQGAVDPRTALGTLWQMQQTVFWPWLEPHEYRSAQLQPWIASDAAQADVMATHWVQTIIYMHHHLAGFTEGRDTHVMNLLWQLYASRLSTRSVPDHVTALLHTHLAQAPWPAFCPTLDDVQAFNKVLDGNESACCEFVCSVAVAVGWRVVLQQQMDSDRGFETAALFHAQLFHLLVRLGAHKSLLKEQTRLVEVLGRAEEFAWDIFLDGNSFQLAAESYCHACDVTCVLAERSSPSAAVLRLLRKASGFYQSGGDALGHPDLSLKRTLHAKCVVQLMCKCTRSKDVNLEALGIGLSNLLTQVETVVSTVSDLSEQGSLAIALCKETLNVLNNCQPQGKTSTCLLDTVLQWIADSNTSPLLYPLLNAACLNLASLPYILSIAEACMDAHFTCFTGEMGSSRDGGWDCLLAALQVPELNQAQFLQQGVAQHAFLTLFAFTIQRLPLSQSIGDEYKHLQNLVAWTAQARPNAENEYKLFLWWTRLLELALRQADMGGPLVEVKARLVTFTQALWLLGEDKASAGLLGAIGLGRRSQLSLRFRMICKCLAAYISVQLPNNLNRPRLSPQDPGHIQGGDDGSPRGRKPPPGTAPPPVPSPQAAQYHAHLESLRQNKDYAGHAEELEFYLEYVADPDRALREAHALLVKLVSTLYPEQACLVILRK